MMNKETNLSEHMTLAELTKTNTGIENVPSEAQVENLKRECREVHFKLVRLLNRIKENRPRDSQSTVAFL